MKFKTDEDMWSNITLMPKGGGIHTRLLNWDYCVNVIHRHTNKKSRCLVKNLSAIDDTIYIDDVQYYICKILSKRDELWEKENKFTWKKRYEII